MPEMPEVQALATDLAAKLVGRRIGSLQVVSFAALKTFDPAVSELGGALVDDVARQGKFLDLRVDSGLHLVVHLARAGWLRWSDRLPVLNRTARTAVAARIVLEDGSGITITEAGTKKGLALWVVRDPADVAGIATLGPEPLDPSFDEAAFAAVLATAGRTQIKGVLRDQGRIAGIGNAYSDEILHAAMMSPFKPAAMTPEEVARLFAATQAILRAAIARADGLPATELKGEKKASMRVHGRTGEACPVCGDVVRQIRFADRTLQYCATCQTGGKPLADRALSRLGITL